jgi:hypothetical protein
MIILAAQLCAATPYLASVKLCLWSRQLGSHLIDINFCAAERFLLIAANVEFSLFDDRFADSIEPTAAEAPKKVREWMCL